MNQDVQKREIWSWWVTAILGFVVLLAWFACQMLGLIAYLLLDMLTDPGGDVQALLISAQGNGDAITITLILGSLAGIIMTLLFAWIKARGATWAYLGLSRTNFKNLIWALGLTVLLVAVSDTITITLHRPIVPEFLQKGYATASWLPIFWLAVCVIAPVFEEVLFRGFLIKGWMNCRFWGPIGAVILTSLIWAGIHVQYGWYELIFVFVTGLLFGAVRIKTGSTTAAIACHVLSNTIATIETAIYLSH